MSNQAVYTFGVNKVDVAPYNSGAAVTTWTNIPVVQDSNVAYTLAKAEVTDGEGYLQAQWFHTQRAKVTLTMSRFHFRALELMSGSPVSSYSGADAIQYGVNAELNPPYFRLRIQQKAIDAINNTAAYFEVILYKCVGVLPPLGAKAVTPTTYQVELDALLSTKDELGNTLDGNGALLRARGPYTASN